MKTGIQFHEEAEFLRDSSGSGSIKQTLLKALKILKLFNIPHYVCGGFAVQEHGYPRFTVNVDIIVPDVPFAIQKLTLNGFRSNPGSKMTVTDRETRVEIDLLPVERNSIRVRLRFRCQQRSQTNRRSLRSTN